MKEIFLRRTRKNLRRFLKESSSEKNLLTEMSTKFKKLCFDKVSEMSGTQKRSRRRGGRLTQLTDPQLQSQQTTMRATKNKRKRNTNNKNDDGSGGRDGNESEEEEADGTAADIMTLAQTSDETNIFLERALEMDADWELTDVKDEILRVCPAIPRNEEILEQARDITVLTADSDPLL